MTQLARDMPLGELYGWAHWYRERNERQSAGADNDGPALELSEMTPEQAERFFG